MSLFRIYGLSEYEVIEDSPDEIEDTETHELIEENLVDDEEKTKGCAFYLLL